MSLQSKESSVLPLRAVHFGAGALGRGLVVPRLVEAGWQVRLADPLVDLVDALAAHRAYDLVLVEGDSERRQSTAIAGALHPVRDAQALNEAIAAATLITTSVRKENLAGVMQTVRRAWAEHGRPESVAIVGCENVEHVDSLIRGHLGEEDGVRIPATVVDRICASDWPATLDIRTEAYTELAVERRQEAPALPGITGVMDIDALFDRKRYLVNTLADASSILGLAQGMRYLSETVGDERIMARLAPLVAALIRHLELRHGLARGGLAEYLETSRRRLANTGIPRRLDTVARDIARKLTPEERFVAPLMDLRARNEDVSAACRVLATLAFTGLRLEGRASTPDEAANVFQACASNTRDDTSIAFYSEISGLIARLPTDAE